MSDATLCYLSATELAERIRRRELSPVAVVRAFLDRIAAIDGELGAYCTVTAEQALDEARAAEAALAGGAPTGPLHGVPVSIKDLVFTRGVRTTRGSAIYADLVPDEGRAGGRAAAGRRGDLAGEDEYAGVRLEGADRQSAVPADAQSVGSARGRPGGRVGARRRPWRPGWGQSVSAATGAARCVFPARSAGWSA